jgi:hypothetical protein
MPSLRLSFYIGALLSVIAAILASMTGSRFVHEEQAGRGKADVVPESVENPHVEVI